ncbi:hypothetical protein DENIS_2053 [Desulfonema ishimotonii]|uniref:Fibronectin type-III domain-containing protein n=1 Tax=Desulfonema ishimotonii TaxID=45657 RepID=A0A401FVW7_9BACT|nr:Calx-beta domain-containing protein [Desulfonema ishimotonii]GBC61093.1 hypothetical protein DENIS_2053 [Desulfonema ishimotonii]
MRNVMKRKTGFGTGTAAAAMRIAAAVIILAGAVLAAPSAARAAFTAMDGGDYFSVALESDGTVWAWGTNYYGQLGDGTTTESSTPVQVSGLTGAADIAAGGYHSLAAKSDGTVWAWGRNYYGQLGDGTTTDSLTPVQVTGLSGVSAVSAGFYYSAAVKSDGTVWAWGRNYYGQLGDGTGTNRLTPVQVTGLTGVSAVSAGRYYTVAVKTDGTVWAWGGNDYGQLGDGTTTNSSTPVQVTGLTGVSAVAAGDYHAAALKTDGTVWTWGRNHRGQLGNGGTTDSSTPVQVTGLTGVSAVAEGGAHHFVALKTDGTVWTWGWNGYGQLGDGTTTDSSTPGQVPGLSGISAIASGNIHTIAVKTDGNTSAWGRNHKGQLGDGTTTNSSTPVHVSGTPLPDDVTYTLAAGTSPVAEGDTGTTPATFTITRSGATGSATEVTYALAGTATNGTDYDNVTVTGTGVTNTGTTVEFAAGATDAVISMDILGNYVDETNRTIEMSISGGTTPSGTSAHMGTPQTTTITDDDTAGITVTPTSGLVTDEGGGTATFTVVLDTEPTADVSINLYSDNTAEGTVSPASLTFTAANWDTAQTVTLTGVDDAVSDGNVGYTALTATPTASTDPNYNVIDPDDVGVTNNDDDLPGFTITPLTLTTTEAGGNATFTVCLNSEPTATVTLPISSSDTTEGTVSPASLDFTTANWSTPQIATVTGVNDDTDDGDQTYSIVTGAATSTDTDYGGMNPTDVSVSNTDDDTAAVSIVQSGGSTAVNEEGATGDTYTVVLTSKPTNPVTITLSFDNTQISGPPATLSFPTADWDKAQTVTVTAIDDSAIEGAHTVAITHAATSGDSDYNGITIGSVTVNITDNDGEATVKTSAAKSVTSGSAVLGGNVTDQGGSAVTERGVCWGTSSDPTIANSKKAMGSGIGTFSDTITGLKPNTSYYVRAYATNSAGTAYGDNVTLKSKTVMPTVVTGAISDVTITSATGCGSVTIREGYGIECKGICWNTSSPAHVSLSPHTEQGDELGDFVSAVTGLQPDTTYYVRAYAQYRSGSATYTFYGKTESFTTPPEEEALPGDVNGDEEVDLDDAIIVLKLLSGVDTGGTEINPDADVNGDGQIGIPEVIYILQVVSQQRTTET